MWTVLKSFLTANLIKILAYAGIAASVIGVLLAVRNSGKAAIQVESLQKTVAAVRRRDEIREDLATASDAELNERLRKNGWLRD